MSLNKCIVIGLFSFSLLSCSQAKKETKADLPEVAIESQSQSNWTKELKRKLVWKNYSFEIIASKDKLSINSTGLEEDNSQWEHDLKGISIQDPFLVDIDLDGFPEIFIMTKSDVSQEYGGVIAYSVYNGKSMGNISYGYAPDSEDVQKGYRGHDVLAIKENKLERSFPVYRTTDSDANPTGGKRIVTYRLEEGEAAKVFVENDIKNIN